MLGIPTLGIMQNVFPTTAQWWCHQDVPTYQGSCENPTAMDVWDHHHACCSGSS